MADLTVEELQESLDKLTGSLNQTTGATQSLAQGLNAGLRDYTRTMKTRKEVEDDVIKYEKARSEAIKAARRQLVDTFSNLVKQSTNLSSATMGAQGAFTSLTPAIDFTVGALGKLADIITLASAGIPIFGDLTERVAQTAKSGLEIAGQLVNFQLNNAQRVADSFINLSQQGASFGGSINLMMISATAAEVSLDTFAKTVNNNVQALVGMGGEVGRNAALVAIMGRRIGDTNDRLLAQYGSFDQLNQGIIDYISLQNAAGIDEIRRNQNLGRTVEQYLIRQREVTALTGKRAEELKKEEEARRRQIAFAAILNDLGPDARQNLSEAFAQVEKFGPEFQTYLQQYLISLRTGIVSREMILLENFLGPAAGAVREIANSINSSKDAFRTISTEILSNAAPAARQAALGLETFGALAQAGYGSDIVKFLSDAAGSLNSSFTAAANAAQQAKDLAANQLVDLTGATKGFTDATRALEQRRITLDRAAIESMSNFQYLVDFGTFMQQKMIDSTRSLGNIINAIANNDMPALTAAIRQFATRVLGITEQAPTGPSARRIAEEREYARTSEFAGMNPSAYALGGVANEPVIAGEAGPEAIIPLANGNVPMDIDWTPMVRAIRELTDKVDETNDINRRILNNSY